MNISSINPTTNLETGPTYSSAPKLNLNLQFTSFDNPAPSEKDIKVTVQQIKSDDIKITIKPSSSSLIDKPYPEKLNELGEVVIYKYGWALVKTPEGIRINPDIEEYVVVYATSPSSSLNRYYFDKVVFDLFGNVDYANYSNIEEPLDKILLLRAPLTRIPQEDPLLVTLDETLFQVAKKEEELNKLKTEFELAQEEITRLKEELQDIHEYTFQTYRKEMSIIYNYAVIALERLNAYRDYKENQTLNEKQLKGLLGSIYKPIHDLNISCIQYICNRRFFIGELLKKSILEKTFDYKKALPSDSKKLPAEQEEKGSIHPHSIRLLGFIYDNAQSAMNAYRIITGQAVRNGTQFTISEEESILRSRLLSIKETITRGDIGLGLRVVRNLGTSK